MENFKNTKCRTNSDEETMNVVNYLLSLGYKINPSCSDVVQSAEYCKNKRNIYTRGDGVLFFDHHQNDTREFYDMQSEEEFRLVPTYTYEKVKPKIKISSDLYYGVMIGIYKGFITKTEYYHGCYTILSSNYITKGNGWQTCDNETLSGIIDTVIKKGDVVFVFNTYKELFKWLSE